MLGGRDQHAFFHQTGCVADSSDVPPCGFHFKTVEIDSAKKDTGPSRGWQDAQVDRRTAMQTDSPKFYWAANCLFLPQSGCLTIRCRGAYTEVIKSVCGKSDTSSGEKTPLLLLLRVISFDLIRLGTSHDGVHSWVVYRKLRPISALEVCPRHR